MLFVVAIQVMGYHVVHFMLLLDTMLLMLIGLRVLLYHLKLVHIILLVVVFLLMVLKAEHSILVSTVVLVLIPGSLALLYHLNLLLHIILVVVEVQIIMNIVVFSFSSVLILLVIVIGELALLYCSSYYSLRGCTSYSGVYCGAFYISADTNASGTYLAYGAALSFRFKINR